MHGVQIAHRPGRGPTPVGAGSVGPGGVFGPDGFVRQSILFLSHVEQDIGDEALK
jgi:hypothetical protein